MYSWRDKFFALGLVLTASSVLAIAGWLRPAPAGVGTHTQLGLPPCNFLRITHLPCPSCGLTTSFAHAIRLNFREAFLTSPFGLFAFFLTAFSIPSGLVMFQKKIACRAVLLRPVTSRAIYAACAVYALSWIFKLAAFAQH